MFHRLEPSITFSRMAVPEEAFKSPPTRRYQKIIRAPIRIRTLTRRGLLPNMEGLIVPAKTITWFKELADQPRKSSPTESQTIRNLSTLTMQISELVYQIFSSSRLRNPAERRGKLKEVSHLVRMS